MRKLLFTLLAAAAMVGCAKDDDVAGGSIDSDNVVKFSSTGIGTRTNAAGDQWVTTDKVGIYTDGFTADYSNVAYKAESAAATTSFTAVDSNIAILFPNIAYDANNKVDFFAYYPYSDTAISDYFLEVDVSDQTDPTAIDFMVGEDPVNAGNNVTFTGYGLGDGNNNDNDVTFKFNHKLSKVTFIVTANDNINTTNTPLTGLTAQITGIETKGSYDITTGELKLSSPLSEQESITLNTLSANTTTASFTAILHPNAYTTPQLQFTLDGKLYGVTLATTLEAGKSYTFNLAIGNDVVEFTGNNSIGGWSGEDGDTLYPEDVTPIDFDDDNFKAALLAMDTAFYALNIDSDTANISYAEAAAYTGTIDVDGEGITSMEEIKYFPNITKLYCRSNSLESLDLSANTKLTYLYCSSNSSLTALNNISACTELNVLSCYNCALTSLDLTANTALTTLNCSENDLTSLSLTENTALTTLNCSENDLTSLSLTENTALTDLNCSENDLTSLSLTENTALEYLNCSENDLTSLSLTENTALEYLDCRENDLDALSLTTNTQLTSLDCSCNSLDELRLTTNTLLNSLCCYNNNLQTLDVSMCPYFSNLVFPSYSFCVGAQYYGYTITVTVTQAQYNAMNNLGGSECNNDDVVLTYEGMI